MAWKKNVRSAFLCFLGDDCYTTTSIKTDSLKMTKTVLPWNYLCIWKLTVQRPLPGRKIRNNQHHACILETNNYLSVYNVQWRIQDYPEVGAPTLWDRGSPTYDFAKFSQKLHEIERIWAPWGASLAPPLDPPMMCTSSKLYLLSTSQ